MKKWLFGLLVIVMAAMAVPAVAGELIDGVVNLGQDHVKMQWYLLGYGKRVETDLPFVVVRKYYTSPSIKNETVELLMSKFGISAERAGKLYFTAYEYEYAKDRKTFCIGALRHYDDVGQEIHATVFDDSSDATKRTWVAVDPKGPSGKSLSYVVAQEKKNAKKK